MTRKALWKTGSTFPALSCLALKLTAFVFFISGLFNAIYFVYNTNTNDNVKRSIFSSAYSDKTRQCELNRRIMMGLRARLEEKEALLREQSNLLETLNNTNTMLKNTLKNLTEALKPTNKMLSAHPKTLATGNSTSPTAGPTATLSTLPFPGDFKNKVERVSRPCCLALKRMTDILRIYMEKEQDLREEIKYYQDLNYTDYSQPEYSDELKEKITKANCTRQFYEANKEWLTKTGKHAIYQTYKKGFFYESVILNRDIPKQKLKSKTSHRTLDFNKVSERAISKVAKDTKLQKELFVTEEALLRYDELSGAEYKLTLRYNNSRKFIVNVNKPFGSHMLMDSVHEQQESQEKELINIIVPITGRTAQLKNFLRDLYDAAIKNRENVFLTVVIYGKDPENKIKGTVKKFSQEHNFGNYDVLKKDAPFNRGRALHDGIMRWNGYSNVLLFLCDIDIKFNQPFLERCRKYAESGKTVYMPVVFSLYNPNIVFDADEIRVASKALNISESTGTWRPLGYGMVCTYKTDYLKTHGFNLAINGWGGEDVSLYHRFRKKGLKVIRAPDPDLYHIWHPKLCSTKLTRRQYETCIGSKARYEGSQRQLGIVLLSRKMTSQANVVPIR